MIGTNRGNFAVFHQCPSVYFKRMLVLLLVPANDQCKTKANMGGIKPFVISHFIEEPY